MYKSPFILRKSEHYASCQCKSNCAEESTESNPVFDSLELIAVWGMCVHIAKLVLITLALQLQCKLEKAKFRHVMTIDCIWGTGEPVYISLFKKYHD